MMASDIKSSSPPEAVETVRRQFAVPHRVIDVAVTEIVLERAGVDAIVGQFVTCAVPKHVRVSFEAEVRFGAGPLHQPCESGCRKGTRAPCPELQLSTMVRACVENA